MASKRRNVANQKKPRLGRYYSFRLDPDLADRFERYAKSLNPAPSLTAHVKAAIEQYLERNALSSHSIRT